jgi:hypothetical protein
MNESTSKLLALAEHFDAAARELAKAAAHLRAAVGVDDCPTEPTPLQRVLERLEIEGRC